MKKIILVVAGLFILLPVVGLLLVVGLISGSLWFDNTMNKNFGKELVGKYFSVTEDMAGDYFKNDHIWLRSVPDRIDRDFKKGNLFFVESCYYDNYFEDVSAGCIVTFPCEARPIEYDMKIYASYYKKHDTFLDHHVKEVPSSSWKDYCPGL